MYLQSTPKKIPWYMYKNTPQKIRHISFYVRFDLIPGMRVKVLHNSKIKSGHKWAILNTTYSVCSAEAAKSKPPVEWEFLVRLLTR